MLYRISKVDSSIQTQSYKDSGYPPFVPYEITAAQIEHISKLRQLILRTQNGEDTDDSPMEENNKIERNLSGLNKGSKVLLLGVGSGREVLAAKSMSFETV